MDACPIPLYVNTDKEAVLMCIRCSHNQDYKKATLEDYNPKMCLDDIQVSEALYDSIKDMDGISYVSGPTPMYFDENGMMD